jgi:hypothetical protein
MGTIAVFLAASLSAAQEAGQPPAPRPKPAVASMKPQIPATAAEAGAAWSAFGQWSAFGRMSQPSTAESKQHHLILQVNANDPAAMNLALNNAMNVTQYYKELGENVKIEIVTFGPGLHMLRDDTSPVKARIEAMALKQRHTDHSAGGSGEIRRRARRGAAGAGLDLRQAVRRSGRRPIECKSSFGPTAALTRSSACANLRPSR